MKDDKVRTGATGRRDFFKGACAAGFMVATAELPAATEGAKFEVGRRGPHSRLATSYAVVDIGLPKPFSVLHISDTHLAYAYPDEHPDKVAAAESRSRGFGGRQEEALAESLEWARNNTDYVIHTGDLVDFQSRANFDLVRKYWGDAMFGSMGNHEFYSYVKSEGTGRTEEFKNRSWEMLRSAYPVDPRFAARVVEGVNFIAIDDVFGAVQPDQVEKFRAEAKKGLPIVLCMHVPFFTTPKVDLASHKFWALTGKKFSGRPDRSKPFRVGSDRWNQHNDPTTVGFIAYLKEEPLLKAILSGHEHMTMEERFSPTAVQYLVGGNFMFAAREVLFV